MIEKSMCKMASDVLEVRFAASSLSCNNSELHCRLGVGGLVWIGRGQEDVLWAVSVCGTFVEWICLQKG